jgi:hypothetical protein
VLTPLSQRGRTEASHHDPVVSLEPAALLHDGQFSMKQMALPAPSERILAQVWARCRRAVRAGARDVVSSIEAHHAISHAVVRNRGSAVLRLTQSNVVVFIRLG